MYWTILIDGAPTAFRARNQEELLPTLAQLKRTNKDVVLKWFARGRLWESQEAERESWRQRVQRPPQERRGKDWRPGGQHKDPRARFDKRARPKGETGPDSRRPESREPDSRAKHRPWSGKPKPPAARGDRPWGPPFKGRPPRRDRPRNPKRG